MSDSTSVLIPPSSPTMANGIAVDQENRSCTGAAVNASAVSTMRIVASILLYIMMKFWKFCTTSLLILLLLYWFYGNLVTFILFIVAILGLFYHSQDLLLYYPDEPAQSRRYVESPTSYGLPFESVSIKTRDGAVIHAYFIKQPTHLIHKTHTMLFLHGNAGNIGHRLQSVKALHTAVGINVLMLEYRGYGRSTDSPSEKGLEYDAQAGLDYLLTRTDIDHKKIFVFGRSLGGAVAISLVSNRAYVSRICALIVENTFTDLPSIGKHLFNFRVVKYLPNWCFKNQYPSLRRISTISVPTLFISGLADTLIPPRMMTTLYQSCASTMKRLAPFPNGTHNQTCDCIGYCEIMHKFLQEVTALPNNHTIPAVGVYSVTNHIPPFCDRPTHTWYHSTAT